MFDFVVSAAFEDVQEANDIAVDVRARICKRVSNSCLRREMNHPVELFRREQLLQTSGVCEISADESKPRSIDEKFEPVLFEADVVVGIEVVEPDNFIATSEQSLSGMKANETGSASDEDLHTIVAVESAKTSCDSYKSLAR